ncbi:glycerol-3-phosphate 1-O-acyltransferase PlsY [Aquabacterium sp.]|uniref:glycerol-3-phosphate 1-O-acyltransferase PlsY n=1 Tax=Aquabacterium sp. TaxID=1872578 RepID=UPI0035AFCED4
MLTPLVSLSVAVVAAYMLGSLSFAVIVSRLFGLSDPRTYGSKNPGATNVLRSGNKGAAILTLVFDALKGWLPAWLAVRWGAELAWPAYAAIAVGGGAFLGHLWPVFFRFEGGKGVATAAGVLLGLSGWLGLACGLVWLVMAVVFRYSSLASLAASVAAPALAAWLFGSIAVAVGVAMMSGLLIWRHAANISKLLAGTESKIGQKAKPAA